jgi:roadblock/LC7 domain-containing protein
MSKSEFDQLISNDGVLLAGRFGPDWRIAEHKSKGMYFENPQAVEMARWFCLAITTQLNSMAFAMDSIRQSGFDQTSWLPQKSWTFSGGDYAIAVYGDRFAFGETDKIESVDELRRLLRDGKP